MAEYTEISHTFAPVFDANAEMLILGTMPSVQSRANEFYYANPQNRFWKVMAGITDSAFPHEKEDKIKLLLKHRIAVWDVLARCEIVGSDDKSIKNPVANDLTHILERSNIAKIFTNGKKADELYRRLCMDKTGMPSICLPSTSPANAAWPLEKLIAYWRNACGIDIKKFEMFGGIENDG